MVPWLFVVINAFKIAYIVKEIHVGRHVTVDI